MAYTRLNLQDYKDKWTAAGVKHLEDGIVENSEMIANIAASSGGNEDVGTLAAILSANTVMPLWMTLLSDGGKKIYPPTLSFNGDVTNKILVPYKAFTPNSEFENGAFYVRIGDPLLVTNFTTGFVATFAGLPHVLAPLLINQASMNGTPIQDYASPEGIAQESMMAFSMQMAMLTGEGFIDGVMPFHSMLYGVSESEGVGEMA